MLENDREGGDRDDEILDEDYCLDLLRLNPLGQPNGPGDQGPLEAWWQAHTGLPWAAWVVFAENAGRRKRAYVLWNSESLQRYGLLKVFDDLPEEDMFIAGLPTKNGSAWSAPGKSGRRYGRRAGEDTGPREI